MQQSFPIETIREAYRVHGSCAKAARVLGCNPSTIAKRLKRAGETEKLRKSITTISPLMRGTSEPVTVPKFASSLPPVSELIERKRKHFAGKQRSDEEQDWFAVNVRDAKPIGILWFGDPHLDDDGCDIGLVESHIALCKTTPGLYGANIGDIFNNWTGRLLRKYADQSTSIAEARQLARWFLNEAGVNWLVHLLGNHDLWEHGGAIIRGMAPEAPVFDWGAKFEIKFPNSVAVKVHAAHSFPGHSMWNTTHAPSRAAKMGGTNADLIVCGHTHEWATQMFEIPGVRRVVTAIRVRGYKWFDDYALVKGFPVHRHGSAILTIIDPTADASGRVLTFIDPAAGAKALKHMRGE